MKVTNKDMIQSYILTTAKYDYSVYEKRILYRIIELMQDYTKGKKLNEKYNVSKTIFDDVDVVMPVSSFLKDQKDQNYTRVKEALLSLNNKVIKYEDNKSWGALNLIERPEVDKIGDCIKFRISPKIAKAFLDFSKGFSKYELETAMKFESIYAMRFYELLSEQKRPITYSVDNLKIMFQIESKYERVNDFFRFVIEPAKKELDKASPYSFEYTPLKTGRKITSIKFYPVSLPQNRDAEIEKRKLQKNTSLKWDLDNIIVNYLKENYIFSEEEIKNNRDLFIAAQNKKDFDFLYFLSEQKRNASVKTNPKGWLINAVKKQIGVSEKKKNTNKEVTNSNQIDLEKMISEIEKGKKNNL